MYDLMKRLYEEMKLRKKQREEFDDSEIMMMAQDLIMNFMTGWDILLLINYDEDGRFWWKRRRKW